MSKDKCELVKDLLPLYADNVCSEESRNIVAEHISHCDECRSELEKMGKHIAIGADKDIKVIKRIKRRVWIERGIIAAVAVFVLSFVLLVLKMSFLDMIKPMDYEKHNLAENVWVEVDESGDLWLCKKGIAAESVYIYPTLRDKNGNHMGYYDEKFDSASAEAYGITLDYRSIIDFSGVQIDSKEERSLLFNINDKADYNEVFYYDAENNKEYILWERD